MTAVTKFLFDTVFENNTTPEEESSVSTIEAEPEISDEEEVLKEVEEEEDFQGYSQLQLEDAKAEAFESGKLQGATESSDTIEKETLITLQAINAQMNELFKIQEQSNNTILHDSIGIAATITRKLFPTMNDHNSTHEIDRFVEQTILRLIEEPRVVIRANSYVIDNLGQRIDTLKDNTGYEGRIILKEDLDVPNSDCRVEWGDGSAERNLTALWESIDEIINDNLEIVLVNKNNGNAPNKEVCLEDTATNPDIDMETEPASEYISEPNPKQSMDPISGDTEDVSIAAPASKSVTEIAPSDSTEIGQNTGNDDTKEVNDLIESSAESVAASGNDNKANEIGKIKNASDKIDKEDNVEGHNGVDADDQGNTPDKPIT